MKRILIVGASVLQLPAIRRAKEMGLTVGVVDYNPEAIGIGYADLYYNASTIDVEAVCRAARDFAPDAVMTLATDMPMRSIAAAAAMLGIPGISPETALKATDKGEMIKAFREAGVEAPWYFIIDSEEALERIAIDFPCIVKPTDNAGSRGVMLVRDREQLHDAYIYSRAHSRCGKVIVEEYLEGKEVSVEIIVVNGKCNVLAVTDKIITGPPHFVEMGHTIPSALPAGDREKIKDVAVRAVDAIGIENGPAHVEVILTADGPRMVELGARMGGDCIATHLVPLATGIDMVGACINVALGMQPDLLPEFAGGSAIRYFNVPVGTIVSVSGVEEAQAVRGVEEIRINKGIGETVGEIENSIDRVGYVVARGDDAEQAARICRRAMDMITIEVR